MTDSRQTVLIVGGGVIGIACAHYLHEAGYRVQVIDQGKIGGACSHANCGYVCPSHVLPLTEPGAIPMAIRSMFQPDSPFRVKPTLNPRVWRWFLEFARRCRHRPMLEAGGHLKSILDASMTEYRRLVRETSMDCEWKESGLLYVLKTDQGMRSFAETDALLDEAFGVRARRIEGSELPQLEPALNAGLAGGFLYEGDTMLRPDRLCSAWQRMLHEQGVRFIESCKLLSVERDDKEIRSIITAQGPMQADHYVFSMGALSMDLEADLDCYLPILPGKGYSVTMERPSICPTHPILFPEHRVGVTPFDQAYRLGSMMEFVGFDDTIPEKRIQQLRSSAEPYLREPHTEQVQETWFGWRPMTWDSMPVIGRVPNTGNAFLATGHNMLGLSLAPSTGRLVCELIAGAESHLDPAPFSPQRFL